MSRRREVTDLENNRPHTGDPKDAEKRLQKLRLEEQDQFIRRGYFVCLLLFLASGLVMVTAVLQGAYKEVVLAETIIVTVLGSIYIVLFIVMICCYGSGQLRIAILLFVAAFVGCVGGFLVGVNLKMVVAHLRDE